MGSATFVHICCMKKRALVQPLQKRWMTYTACGNQESLLPPLILLHGLCEDHTVWDDIVPTLEPHGPVYCLDLPGFGESESPEEIGMEAYVWAVATLAREQGIQRMALAGHSLGGYVALQSIASLPDMLQGVVLVHSHPFTDTPERAEGRRRSLKILEQGHLERFVRQLFPGLFAPHFAQKHPEMIEKCIRMGLRQPIEGIIAAIKAMQSRQDHTSTLVRFAHPIMAILGSEDNLVPLQETRKAVDQAPCSEVHILEGVGHMSMFEDRQALVEHLIAFWKRLTSSNLSR